MAEVTMSLEEYLELIDKLSPQTAMKMIETTRRVPAKKKRAGKKDPKMARALKKANAIGRTKAGKLRKGYTQAKIMKKAHQLRRRM
jgi:hypothetical protein